MNTDPQPASTMAPLLDGITGSGVPCFRDGMTVAELEARCRKLAARCGRYPTVTASIGQSDRYLTVWANAACHRFFSAKPDFETAFAEADAWLLSQSVPPEWWDMPELAA